MKIEQDHGRFREIVRGRIKKELRRYISRGELIGKQGDRLVSIPVPSVDLPNFRFGDNSGGVGQGEGDPGTPIDGEEGGGGQAGNAPGAHILEVEVTLEELAQMLGEELALPRIEPRGKRSVVSRRDKYRSVRRTGPESLSHFKRTYRKALRRQLASGKLRSRETPDRAHPRGPHLPIVDRNRGAPGQRRRHLHDGRFRLHG